jgi:hypothetical protein
MTQFDELLTQLNDALDRWDKLRYREILLSANLSAFTQEEGAIVEKWMIRERAMVEIEKQPLNMVLKEQNIIFDRATEADPDYYYPPQREHAYTPGVDDYLIALDHLQQLRTLTYDEFIDMYFEHK